MNPLTNYAHKTDTYIQESKDKKTTLDLTQQVKIQLLTQCTSSQPYNYSHERCKIYPRLQSPSLTFVLFISSKIAFAVESPGTFIHS